MRRTSIAALLAALSLGWPAVAPAAESPITTVRPTGVGLPIITTDGGDLQAGDQGALIEALFAYHASGQYELDLWQVARAARRSLVRQHERLPRRAKPAIVLDIDETALSNWAEMAASDFGAKRVPEAAAAQPDPAIAATLAVYRSARKRGIAVFFISGRAPDEREYTLQNLRAAGYDQGWAGAHFCPPVETILQCKSGTRAAIEKQGYTILVNMGDQQSDLQGGHARQAFKLPNPFYFIG